MRSSGAAALLLAAALAPPAAASVDLFPRPNEIFPVLTADPRRIQLSASYHRFEGRDESDIGLGHAWGLMRGRAGDMQDWLWETDLEGMAFSRFTLGGGINEFQTVDFYAGLPLTARRGDVSFKGTLFHESSHLGDDWIRRTGSTGYRFSTEGLQAQAAIDPLPVLRLYGGARYLLHTVPSPARWSAQAGLELTSEDLRWSKEVPTRLFLAEDLQWRERAAWNADSHLVVGVKFGFKESPSRAMRVGAGWYDGHSAFGQFFARRERWLDLSAALEL
ncbi:MAG: DUF1207 domain-containing protein [Elusimicrobia bacterium]|nr:DUF1207 domain-containing protein [Elusimicrobiota bacterium]